MEPPQEPPQPDPAMILAQAEVQKNREDNEMQKLKLVMEDDRRRDELEADYLIKLAEMEAKYGSQINVAEIRSILERDKEELRQRVKLAGLALGQRNGAAQ